jgi:hypothetical protein
LSRHCPKMSSLLSNRTDLGKSKRPKMEGVMIERLTPTINWEHYTDGMIVRMLPDKDGKYVLYTGCRDKIATLTAENERLRINATRYESLRKINPRQFTEMWRYNLDGVNVWKTFDELVDALKPTELGGGE